jgi:hypothetical protein
MTPPDPIVRVAVSFVPTPWVPREITLLLASDGTGWTITNRRNERPSAFTHDFGAADLRAMNDRVTCCEPLDVLGSHWRCVDDDAGVVRSFFTSDVNVHLDDPFLTDDPFVSEPFYGRAPLETFLDVVELTLAAYNATKRRPFVDRVEIELACDLTGSEGAIFTDEPELYDALDRVLDALDPNGGETQYVDGPRDRESGYSTSAYRYVVRCIERSAREVYELPGRLAERARQHAIDFNDISWMQSPIFR